MIVVGSLAGWEETRREQEEWWPKATLLWK
jgi:hypothetical protein